MDHKNKRKASWDSKVSSSVLLIVACLNFLLSSHGTILVFRHSFRRDRAIVFSPWAYNTEWIILCLTPISYSFAVCSASKKQQHFDIASGSCICSAVGLHQPLCVCLYLGDGGSHGSEDVCVFSISRCIRSTLKLCGNSMYHLR